MAYLGNGPLLGAYTHVDDISSGFNGTDVTFNITKNSISKTPVRAENFLVSIDGVFQEPYEAYDVLSNTITFTEAPLAGSSFFGIILGNVLNIGAIPDGSVTIDKMTNGSVDSAKIVDGAVTAAKLGAGAVDTASIADSAITQAKLDLSSNLAFADGEKATFGAGSDLQIYHDGSNSVIADFGTGLLDIKSDGAAIQFTSNTGELYAYFANNGPAQLYFDNSKKIETTATGIDVTGNATFDDNGKAIFGAGSDLQIYHDGSNSVIADNGTGNLLVYASTDLILQQSGSANRYADFAENGAGRIYHSGNVKLTTTALGADVTGELIADSYNETYLNITSSSGTANFDCESGNTFSITLSENVTTTNFQNPPASGIGYTMTIELIQDAGASGYVMAWPTSVDWPSATAPTPTPGASGKDVFVFTTRDGGTTWYGFTAGQALA
jgi:hypothetical protein